MRVYFIVKQTDKTHTKIYGKDFKHKSNETYSHALMCWLHIGFIYIHSGFGLLSVDDNVDPVITGLSRSPSSEGRG